MRRIAFCLVLLGSLLLVSTEASAQAFGAQYVISPPKAADLLLAGGLSFYPFRIADRVYLGGNALLGGMKDDSDPSRFGKSHWHLTGLVGPSVAVRVGGSFGVTGSYNWGFLPKAAKDHMSTTYRTFAVGIVLGLPH